MLGRQEKEELNFIERKRQWRSEMDKPLGTRMFVMVAPIIVMSVFALLCVPYIPKIADAVQKALGGDPGITNLSDVGGVEAPPPAEKPGPPPSPEEASAAFYQKRFAEEGFDWTKTPELKGFEAGTQQSGTREIQIKPVPVELPLFAYELESEGEGSSPSTSE